MHDNTPPKKQHPRKTSPKTLKPVLILLVLIALVAIGAGLFYFKGADEALESVDSVPLTGEDRTSIGTKNVEDTSPRDSSLSSQDDVLIITGEEGPADETPFSEMVTESTEETRAKECGVLAEQVHGFFNHVDSEDYMKKFELKEPSQTYFIALADKLLKNPPVVSRESDDLYTILKNMAHFFRVIGKDNIILIKTILDRERDKIEDVAAELYQWTAWKTCKEDLLAFSPSLEEMYEYAGFFLNTMGGRSYLFRRDSRSRLLVNYYSVLLIERANMEGLNRHGIDIIQIIPQLIQEIDSSNQLIYKENYIDSLYTLLEKYQ